MLLAEIYIQDFMKLKLLYFVTEDSYFCSHRLALARAAKLAGYEVSVLTRENEHGDVIRNEGFKLIPLNISRGSINPLRELKTLVEIWRAYNMVKPDIVHHVALKPVLYGGVVTFLNKKIKVVNLIAGLGAVFSSSKLKAKLLQPFVKLLLRALFRRSSSRVVVQNSEDRLLLINDILINSGFVTLIKGSGVDTEAFPVRPFPEGRVRIALVSRLLWDKGVGEFIEAVNILKNRKIEFDALLVGKPDNENISSVSQQQLDQWQQDGMVECTGFVGDIAGFWQRTHIAVLPSYYGEGIPKCLIEASSSGRPAVTTDTSGCNEIIRDGVNGFLVPVRDAFALANALEKLIVDASLREKMGALGRKMVEEEFSDKKIIAETLDVYQLVNRAA